jgi:Protein of unknown function (DUF1064)
MSLFMFPAQKTKQKYKNQRTIVDGVTFSSKKEASRYLDLNLLVRIGDIDQLEVQPRYKLVANGKLICAYVADFKYRDKKTLTTVVEDVKGIRTPVYRIKRKLMLAIHGIDILET